MGKYLRKPKLTGDTVSVMDISPSSLGVCTRAKTLALQKLQSSTAAPPPDHRREPSYLQLRSRKLEKPPLQKSSNFVIRSGGSGSVGSGSNYANVQSQNVAEEEIKANCEFGSEDAFFGENNVEFDGRERGTRESTPCSFIRSSNDSITPGSSTRNRYASNGIMQRIMPSAQEIDDFFALHAQEQQRFFSEKYNFDIVNEKPLKGRYEWVRVQP